MYDYIFTYIYDSEMVSRPFLILIQDHLIFYSIICDFTHTCTHAKRELYSKALHKSKILWENFKCTN